LGAIAVGLTGVLVAVIKNVGDIAIEYLAKKKKVVEQTLKLDQHAEEIETAKQIWNIVEEKYRITDNIENLAKSKADAFDKMLLDKIPGITEDQVKQLRQAIAGEINKGKAMLSEDTLKQQAQELVTKNNTLVQENLELKTKLNAISSYVPKEQQ
ncbi:MAG: cobalt ABC transporter permease, partial [Clostridia bacterium]